MQLHHTFTVPARLEKTWAHFTDIEGVAGCFPGATVTEADAESFTGTVKVKLGPIALVYNGTGAFVEKDEAGHRLVIDAKGKDKRGNGTAGAMVTATMAETASGATEVDVSTDLSITGKAAQFGRGNVIQDVSDKLLGQFVACLEQRLAPESGETAGAAVAEPDPAAPAGPGEEPDPTSTRAGVPDPQAPERPAADVPPQPRPAPPPPARREDAVNLGTTVLPVLARTYWKPVAAAVAVVLVIWWLVARG